jgi:hypothetical protein
LIQIKAEQTLGRYAGTMEKVLPAFRIPPLSTWRELVVPREHGSWSLALEPLAFGLIIAPSVAGGWLAVAVMAAFFARRPLRIAWNETRPARRQDAFVSLVACGLISLLAAGAAITVGGVGPMGWLVPSMVAGGCFLAYDLRNGGREEAAEIAGAAAFAMLPMALAAFEGATPAVATSIGVVMCARAVPAVMGVRAALRAAKTGIRRPTPALTATIVALVMTAALVRMELAPATALAAVALLTLRTGALLVYPRIPLRARTIGMIEALLGVAFVIAVGIAWR